jgi:hypothetical protein
MELYIIKINSSHELAFATVCDVKTSDANMYFL